MTDKKNDTGLRPVKPSDPAGPADATAKISNVDDGSGTRQAEPTPEELPGDAKIAPANEQIAPNQMAQSVGAIETEEEEGRKTLQTDMSSAERLLPEDSEQVDAAKRAEQKGELRSKGDAA